jgi:hypothetical protein
MEARDDAAKESMVLNRIRMLDVRLSNGDKASPSAHTRKNVHPFNRAIKSNNIIGTRPQQAQNHLSFGPESRDTDSSSRPVQNSHRDTIQADRYPPTIRTDQNHLSQIRNSSPRGDRGSPLSRDDTVHAFPPSKGKPGSIRRNVSPFTHAIGTETSTRSKYELSPSKAVRDNSSPDPSRKATTQVLQDNSPGFASRNLNLTVDDSRNRNNVGVSPIQSRHPFNESQRKTKSSQIHETSPLVNSISLSSNQKASNIEKPKLPSRVALHFTRDESPSTTNRTASPVMDAHTVEKDQSKEIANKRHHWDKGNVGGANTKSATPASGTKSSLVLDIEKSSKTKQSKDPSPRNSNQPVSKPEPEPILNHTTPFQTKIQREYRKIPPSPRRRAVNGMEGELERNLNSASIVMCEEKASSVGTSSSSDRSGLSQAELGGIAERALKLSEVKGSSTKRNNTLQQIVSTKRSDTNSAHSHAAGRSNHSNVPYAYSSAQRLSERLTRAERFTALKMSKHSGRTETNNHHSIPSPLAPSENYTHPVFGYTKNSLGVNTIEASEGHPTLSPEPSCVRRSKHLSKSLQSKAYQFALSSPTRRSIESNKNFGYSSEIYQEGKLPDYHGSQDHFKHTQDRQGYDPLGLSNARASHPYKNGNHHHDTYTYKDSIGKKQQLPYEMPQPRSAFKNDQQLYAANQKVQVMPKMAVHRNYPVKQKQQSRTTLQAHTSSSVTDTLSPGQKLEILALEQRSKLKNEHAWQRQGELPTRQHEESDIDSKYSDDGVSSVDGDIFYNEAPPSVLTQYEAESRPASHTIRMNEFPVGNNQQETKQVNIGHLNDTNQSYRHTSKRPESLPITHFTETPSARCDNTFTGSLNKSHDIAVPTTTIDKTVNGSLNKKYNVTTPTTAFDNTFTGSLNQNVFLNDSSDSSVGRPNAFKWLHQKYGNQAPTVPEVAARNQVISNPANSRHPETKQYIDHDDDDDVFFGLDEVNVDVDQNQFKETLPELYHTLNGGNEKMCEDSIPREEPHKAQRRKKSEYENYPTLNGENEEMCEDSIPREEPHKAERRRKSEYENEIRTPTEGINDFFGDDDNFDSERNESPKMDNVKIVDSHTKQKKRNRPNPVETIVDDADKPLSGIKSTDREDDADEDSEQDENKPPPSVLKNIGSAIVKSIQRACAIPGNLSSYFQVAYSIKG